MLFNLKRNIVQANALEHAITVKQSMIENGYLRILAFGIFSLGKFSSSTPFHERKTSLGGLKEKLYTYSNEAPDFPDCQGGRLDLVGFTVTILSKSSACLADQVLGRADYSG